MKNITTYHIIVYLVLILSSLFAGAQSKQYVVVNSQSEYQVEKRISNDYLWEIFDEHNNNAPQTNFNIVSVKPIGKTDNILSTTNKISVNWVKEGKYNLRLTEKNTNNCSRYNYLNVSVLKLDFQDSSLPKDPVPAITENSPTEVSFNIDFIGENLDDANNIELKYSINGEIQPSVVCSNNNQNIIVANSTINQDLLITDEDELKHKVKIESFSYNNEGKKYDFDISKNNIEFEFRVTSAPIASKIYPVGYDSNLDAIANNSHTNPLYIFKNTKISFRTEENANYKYFWGYLKPGDTNAVDLGTDSHITDKIKFNKSGIWTIELFVQDKISNAISETRKFYINVLSDKSTLVISNLEELRKMPICSGNKNSKEYINVKLHYEGALPWTFEYYTSLDVVAKTPDDAISINKNDYILRVPRPINDSDDPLDFSISLVNAKTVIGDLPVTEDPANQEVTCRILPHFEYPISDHKSTVLKGETAEYTIEYKTLALEILWDLGSLDPSKVTYKGDKKESIVVDWDVAPGDYTISYTPITALCDGETKSFTIKVVDEVGVQITDGTNALSNLSICKNTTKEIVAEVNFPGTYTYNWTLPGGDSQSGNNNKVTVNKGGEYTVVAIDEKGKESNKAVLNVTILDLPIVDLGEDAVLFKSELKILDAGNPGAQYVWSNGAKTQTITVNKEGNYSVEVIDINSCKGSDDVNILYNENSFSLEFENSTVAFCKEKSITLEPTLKGVIKDLNYKWTNKNDPSKILATSKNYTTSKEGIYEIEASKKDDANDAIKKEITVNLLESPALDFPEIIDSYKGQSVILDALNPNSTYLWSTNETTQRIVVEKEGVYSVIVTNEHNCTANDEVEVVFKEDNAKIILPNAFSPNGDGLNDVFRVPPVYIKGIVEFNMIVYDRVGTIVYNSKKIDKGWDGRYKGKIQQLDTYFYEVKFKTVSGRVEKISGTVTLAI